MLLAFYYFPLCLEILRYIYTVFILVFAIFMLIITIYYSTTLDGENITYAESSVVSLSSSYKVII